MSAENNKAVKSDEAPNTKQTVDTSRRSFTKIGGVLAPVVMTLANRPVWAGTNVCQSGFTSFTAATFVASHTVFSPPPGSNWHAYTAWLSDADLSNDLKNKKLWQVWTDYTQGSPTGELKVWEALTYPIQNSNENLAYEVATRLNIMLKTPHSVLVQLLIVGPQTHGTTGLTYYQIFYQNCSAG